MGRGSIYLPRQQFVDHGVVVVVVSDAKEAVDVVLDGATEQGRVNGFVSGKGKIIDRSRRTYVLRDDKKYEILHLNFEEGRST